MKTVPSATHLIAAGVIAGAFVVGFLSGPALAGEPPSAEAFKFDFESAPSELANSQSARGMLARLERNVQRQCGAYDRMPVADRKLIKACIDETMSNAVATFGSATLAEAYKTRTGG
jgi:UrcA family protein